MADGGFGDPACRLSSWIIISRRFTTVSSTASPAEFPDTFGSLNRRSLVVGRGGRIDTNTYFNGFFEAYWHRHSAVENLVLRLRRFRQGHGPSFPGVRRLRHRRDRGTSISMAKAGPSKSKFPLPAGRAASFGRSSSKWSPSRIRSRSSPPSGWPRTWPPNRCNSLPAIAPSTAKSSFSGISGPWPKTRAWRITSREPSWSIRARGKLRSTPSFARCPGGALAKTSFFRQANFGGTGGFTRCILEAMRLPGATHVLLFG